MSMEVNHALSAEPCAVKIITVTCRYNTFAFYVVSVFQTLSSLYRRREHNATSTVEHRYYLVHRFLLPPSQIKLLNVGNDYAEDIKKYEQRCKLANLSKGENPKEQSNRARSFRRYVNVLFSTNISFPITIPQRLLYAITLRQVLIRPIVPNFKKKALWILKLSVF